MPLGGPTVGIMQFCLNDEVKAWRGGVRELQAASYQSRVHLKECES